MFFYLVFYQPSHLWPNKIMELFCSTGGIIIIKQRTYDTYRALTASFHWHYFVDIQQTLKDSFYSFS